MADITITSKGATFTIEFHKTAYKCWHTVFPCYVDEHVIITERGDYTYRNQKGHTVLASASLSRAMAAIAEQITRTEY